MKPSGMIWGRVPSYNTVFPQLEDDARSWDAAELLKWKSINLDTLEIKNQPDFKVDSSAHQQQEYAFIGEGTVQDKIGFVTCSQVGGDGYIYFMTGSTHEVIDEEWRVLCDTGGDVVVNATPYPEVFSNTYLAN